MCDMKVVVVLYMKPVETGKPAGLVGIFEQMGGGVILLFLLWAGIAPSPLLALIARLLPTGG